MKIKVNHWASKDPNFSTTFGVEAVVTEIFIGILCSIFAYIGYFGGLILLFVLCLPAAIACFISAGFTVHEQIQYKQYIARQKDKEEKKQDQKNEIELAINNNTDKVR